MAVKTIRLIDVRDRGNTVFDTVLELPFYGEEIENTHWGHGHRVEGHPRGRHRDHG